MIFRKSGINGEEKAFLDGKPAIPVNTIHVPAVCEFATVPVIASGGAGCMEDFTHLFREIPSVDAGLAASIFHFGEVKIPDLKKKLKDEGIPVRL